MVLLTLPIMAYENISAASSRAYATNGIHAFTAIDHLLNFLISLIENGFQYTL